MSPALDSVPQGVLVALVGLIFLAFLLLIWTFLRWMKNVFRNRLPRPFLGEGPNMEWAQTKKAELEERQTNLTPTTYGMHEEAATWLKESEEVLREDEPHRGSQSGTEVGPLILEDSVQGDKEALLKEWLSESGHIDDEWAENLVRRMRPSEESE